MRLAAMVLFMSWFLCCLVGGVVGVGDAEKSIGKKCLGPNQGLKSYLLP